MALLTLSLKDITLISSSYRYKNFDDWSHIRETPIVQEYHFRVIMRTDQDGFLISQYQPKYAVDFLRDHRPGLYEDGHYTDITYYHVLYNEIFDNDYRIYANEQWEFYFLKTDYN